ncbi:MAG: hypothetical protein A3D92_14145 [Bacteroidetes bacterium RIFCSPHIGHO2_02_FULL_44_7]|nr:MAG: hypothetical protein A3D92_14145 [Bacteroidetes bacterium RIFCSPHIGHO2_02_FULL_44_7]
MRFLLISTLLFCTPSLLTLAQKVPSQGYHLPIGIPPLLASNFGELRANHFHMGIDFKTNGKTGYNLYSIDDGYVSRIKVSPYGYGKVIYIDHANGVTSVYAHCEEFKGEIDSLVRRTQRQEQNYEVEIFPDKTELLVKRGQVIALSGNTGSSTAPHLHFELRDTPTEHALNPLVYGFDIPDSKAPEIRGLKIYAVSKEGYRYPGKGVYHTATKGSSNYYVNGNTITVPGTYEVGSGGLGFAFDVIDRLDGATNECGLYASILIVDGDTIFGQKIDRIPFESTRYVNCHKDYEEFGLKHRKLHKSFKTRENDLPIYTVPGLGIVPAHSDKGYKIKYIAWDVKGNRSTLEFTLKITPTTPGGDLNPFYGMDVLQPSQPMEVKAGTTTIEFPSGAVYEPLKIPANKAATQIGDPEIPVHNSYLIRIKNTDTRDGKHYLEMISAGGKTKALEVKYDGDYITCEARYFGRYSIKRDTIKPSITPLNFTAATKAYTRPLIQWKISDAGIGLADYDLFIDGEWQLLEYEYKNNTVTYKRPASMKGEKDILIRVKDACGNVAEWKTRLSFP